MMIKVGDTGKHVVDLQFFLDGLGLADVGGKRLALDGIYGPATAFAVNAFQRDHGLPQTGTFDEATEAAARALGFEDTTRREGVDVSVYQTDGQGHSFVDWSALGVTFGYARASIGLHRDDAYPLHADDMAKNNVVPGAYHFFSPSVDPFAQLRAWFDSAGPQPTGSTLPPALDIENNRATELTPMEAHFWANSARALVLEAEHRFGRDLVIYSNPKTIGELRVELDGFWSKRRLWLAAYTTGAVRAPVPWSSYALHQWAGDVMMPGARCKMDRNSVVGESTWQDLLAR